MDENKAARQILADLDNWLCGEIAIAQGMGNNYAKNSYRKVLRRLRQECKQLIGREGEKLCESIDEKKDESLQYCEDCLYWAGNNGVCETSEWELCDLWQQKYTREG